MSQTEVMEHEAASGELIEWLQTRQQQYLQSKIRPDARVLPRCSDLVPCVRYQALMLDHWEELAPTELWLMARFEAGHAAHDEGRAWFAKCGIEIVEHEKPFQVKDRDGRKILSGHIDGKIVWDNRVPFDIKSLNPYSFGTINSVEDFRRAWWTEKYPIQLASYLYNEAAPWGLFILTNRLGAYKYFPIFLEDYWQEIEQVLQMCREAVDASEKGTADDLPFLDRPEICQRCKLFEAGLCNPPLNFGEGVHVVADEQLAQELAEHQQLEQEVGEQAKELAALDKRIKAKLKAREAGEYLVGDFLARIKEQSRKGYTVAATTSKRISWQSVKPVEQQAATEAA